MLSLILDIASLICIMSGTFLVFSTAMGMVRFRDTMARLHPVTKPQTLGLVLTVTGAILRVVGSENFGVSERGDLGALVLIILFALITAPVVGQRIGRIARREGLYNKDFLSRDDTEKTEKKPS